jgi:hypothetical protein
MSVLVAAVAAIGLFFWFRPEVKGRSGAPEPSCNETAWLVGYHII